MSLNYSYGPSLGAELAYRRERLIQAGSRTRRVRGGRARRATRARAVQTGIGRLGLARPAH